MLTLSNSFAESKLLSTNAEKPLKLVLSASAMPNTALNSKLRCKLSNNKKLSTHSFEQI